MFAMVGQTAESNGLNLVKKLMDTLAHDIS